MAKLLLPTLSSLAFLPTVSIAAKRRFHMEAMVYLFTMFFVAVSVGPGWGGPPQAKVPQPEDRGRLPTTLLCFVVKKGDSQVKEKPQGPGRGLGEPFLPLVLVPGLV